MAKALGPTEATRAQFAKSGLGSLLGGTVVLLGLILTYFTILALLWTFGAGPLGQMRTAFGDMGFFALLASFPAIIIAFNIIPAGLTARRERRLKRLTLAGGVAFEPGYFRLHPYGAGDASKFKRNDGADVALLDWVRRADDPLLYLSGPSGSGKSSLIAASLEPQLLAEGWAIINARLFGDPLPQIARAFAPDYGQPATPDHVYALMATAMAAHHQTQTSPLLLIIDQFEEYLILSEAAQQAPLQALLKQLVRQPIDGLKLLLSLRSDYQALIFQQDLPPARSTINWFQLAPYRRGDAEAFLQSGGKQMTREAINALFYGLDRIEETRGLYRPISLNMIGLVLERMGQTIEGDPQTLIQSYLKSALLTGNTKDYVRPLLENMISDAGTKIPLSNDELSSKTGLEHWQVSAAMADLESRGLVRPLHGAAKGWEIAHDFLARLLGQMLGRVRLPLLTRARPYAAPVGLALWMAALGFGVQYGMVEYQTYLRDRLSDNGWTITAVVGGKFSADSNRGLSRACSGAGFERDLRYLTEMKGLVSLQTSGCGGLKDVSLMRGLTSLTSLDLSHAGGVKDLAPLSTLTSLTRLDLSFASGVKDLAPLSTLTSLTGLSLSNADGVKDLAPLSTLTSLTRLDLSFASGVKDLAPLSTLTSLTSLGLSNADGVKDLAPLSTLTSLTSLNLSNADGVKDLAPLSTLMSLTSLNLSNADGVKDLAPLSTLTSLTNLELNNANGVKDLAPLSTLTSLTDLDLSFTGGVTDLAPLSTLTSLTSLNLTSAGGFKDLAPLSALKSLTDLDLSGATGVTDLAPLSALTSLTSLNLSYATGVTDLAPLSKLTSLTDLDLSFATGVTDLAPLKGRKIRVVGVSEELLATMR